MGRNIIGSISKEKIPAWQKIECVSHLVDRKNIRDMKLNWMENTEKRKQEQYYYISLQSSFLAPQTNHPLFEHRQENSSKNEKCIQK